MFFTWYGPPMMAFVLTLMMAVNRTHPILWASVYSCLAGVFYLNYRLFLMAMEAA